MPRNLIIFTSILLFVSIAKLPIDFYSFLRWVVCPVFGWAAYISHSRGYLNITWVFAILVLLFNPLFPFYLNKDIWMFIDIGSAIFLLMNMKHIRHEKELAANNKKGIETNGIQLGEEEVESPLSEKDPTNEGSSLNGKERSLNRNVTRNVTLLLLYIRKRQSNLIYRL